MRYWQVLGGNDKVLASWINIEKNWKRRKVLARVGPAPRMTVRDGEPNKHAQKVRLGFRSYEEVVCLGKGEGARKKVGRCTGFHVTNSVNFQHHLAILWTN